MKRRITTATTETDCPQITQISQIKRNGKQNDNFNREMLEFIPAGASGQITEGDGV